MKIDFYGTKVPPPTMSIVRAFGPLAQPVRLTGGQGTAYQAGDIVLKPSEGADGGVWAAEVFSKLPESDVVRFARPVKSVDDSWIHGGYVAWSYLPGDHVKGHYDKKFHASRAFHTLLKGVPKPTFLGVASNSWYAADLVAWQKRDFDYGPEFQELFDRISPHLQPYEASAQLIHGDLSGNFLLEDGLPPAIIDFSPAWAPDGFAEGIMLVDALTWEGANADELEIFKGVPHIDQLAWRGVLRRIAEQGEHMTWFSKDKAQALEEARAFERAIDYLEANFS